MKKLRLIFYVVLLSFISNCTTPTKTNLSTQKIAYSDEQPENKRLGQILSFSTDNKSNSEILVIDLGQKIAFLIEKNGRISESISIESGQVLALNGMKEDFRPPTGIYSLENDKKNQKPHFVSLLPVSKIKNSVREFSPLFVSSRIEEYACRTKNCLAFKSQDMQKLSQRLSKGRLLTIILRRGEWLSEESHSIRIQNMERFLNDWKTAWESRDISRYMNLYASEFTNPNFSRKKWMNHKSNLFSNYKKIEIELGSKTILNFGSIYFAQFEQSFKSNSYSDVGVKTLVLSADESPRIIFEDWIKP